MNTYKWKLYENSPPPHGLLNREIIKYNVVCVLRVISSCEKLDVWLV
jgi:hypothetical protein